MKFPTMPPGDKTIFLGLHLKCCEVNRNLLVPQFHYLEKVLNLCCMWTEG